MAIMKKDLNFFIQTHCVDVNDKIKPASVFEFFQDLAAMHADEINVGYELMKAQNYGWVILYETYEVIKSPKFLENVVVKTWPKPKGRLEFEREYVMESTDGQMLIKAISNWVVIDLISRSLVRSDKIKYEGEYYEYTNYPERSKRRIGLDEGLITDYFEYEVKYDDLDHNGHMNNVRYLVPIYNSYPFENKKCYCKKVEIAFVSEARWKDNIKIGHYSLEGNKEAYIGKVNDKLCFECVMTMEEL